MTTALTNMFEFRHAHPESSVIRSGPWPSPPRWKYGRAEVQRLQRRKVEQERPVYEWMFWWAKRSPCRCYRESGSNLSHTINSALTLPTHDAQPISVDYNTKFRETITASSLMDVLWPWKIIYGVSWVQSWTSQASWIRHEPGKCWGQLFKLYFLRLLPSSVSTVHKRAKMSTAQPWKIFQFHSGTAHIPDIYKEHVSKSINLCVDRDGAVHLTNHDCHHQKNYIPTVKIKYSSVGAGIQTHSQSTLLSCFLKHQTLHQVGMSPIEMTLSDIDGTDSNLNWLLIEPPVLLLWAWMVSKVFSHVLITHVETRTHLAKNV